MTLEFAGTATPLSDADIQAAAEKIRCPRAVIDAVCDVESAGSGFLPDHRPKILFEAAVFGRLTGQRWTRANPNVSAARWDRSLYGPAGAHQYDRLAEAIGLDRFAALQSASWGRFQVLGTNYRLVGYTDVEVFVRDQCESEVNHLAVFLKFCEARKLYDALRSRDWETFARAYNGPGHVDHYAAMLRAAFARHSALEYGPAEPVLHLSSHGPAVAHLQVLLTDFGYPLDADGIFGPDTLSATRQFQAESGLVPDGVVGAQTWSALTQYAD